MILTQKDPGGHVRPYNQDDDEGPADEDTIARRPAILPGTLVRVVRPRRDDPDNLNPVIRYGLVVALENDGRAVIAWLDSLSAPHRLDHPTVAVERVD